MKNKKWFLYILGFLAGTCIYTAYRLGAPATVFLWGTAIAVVILLVVNHIFRLYPSRHKPAREAYVQYQERQQDKKIEKQQRKT
ncbi:hypothetical protein F4X88_07000 [Candidatus Poribacteria bacterium]|nr:hypothetical protein [Candidatus Poribacteria bacterium]